jgi:two-component system chemotaxis sensor kinase CheA
MKWVFAMNDSDNIVKEFLVESYENLDRLDRDLIVLEKNPHDREILASVFRTIHTIKGTSGFLGFNKLGAVAHVGENLLGRLRDGQLTLDREITTGLLAMVDAVRQMLASIDGSGLEGDRDDSQLISRLTTLQAIPEAPVANTIFAGSENPPSSPISSRLSIGDILMDRAGVAPAEIQRAAQKQKEGDKRPMGEILLEQGAVRPHDVLDALRVQQTARAQSASDSTIRLDVGLLDQLMNQVGELVLARNQILQFANSTEDSALVAASQRLNLITSELQEGVMKTRMQPIGNIWDKFPRTVRDLAVSCGKQVRVVMEGRETELDKTLIEAIKDPLTHLVRNSVDHGIELPELRKAAGKNPEGLLTLRAFHEGGQVNIDISDDGAGLDQNRIRNKALQKGLISAEQATRFSDREIVNLVFLPGFSTAETVTNVSGRGVGMDVVKTHIEKIGGTVDLQSKPGQGVLVRMKIPLTLAIIPALIVTGDGERYAVPQVSLLELVRIDGADGQKGIEMIHGAPVYRLRGRLLPLVYLNRELKREPETGSVPDTVKSRTVGGEAAPRQANIAVLQADGHQFGLVVDAINDTEEIVVKPLSSHLKHISVYAGAAIMGDGTVALILDVLGLAHASGILAGGNETVHEQEVESGSAGSEQKEKLVLFTGRAGSRIAVPLDMLARLEIIPGAMVERSGNQWVTQYRGDILPLIRISHALEERRQPASAEGVLTFPTEETLQVLVLESGGQSVGLVVHKILDIVESAVGAESPATRAGVLHSSVIEERVTELLDVPAILLAGEAHEPVVTGATGAV